MRRAGAGAARGFASGLVVGWIVQGAPGGGSPGMRGTGPMIWMVGFVRSMPSPASQCRCPPRSLPGQPVAVLRSGSFRRLQPGGERCLPAATGRGHPGRGSPEPERGKGRVRWGPGQNASGPGAGGPGRVGVGGSAGSGGSGQEAAMIASNSSRSRSGSLRTRSRSSSSTGTVHPGGVVLTATTSITSMRVPDRRCRVRL